jgi:hypothetical protein
MAHSPPRAYTVRSTQNMVQAILRRCHEAFQPLRFLQDADAALYAPARFSDDWLADANGHSLLKDNLNVLDKSWPGSLHGLFRTVGPLRGKYSTKYLKTPQICLAPWIKTLAADDALKGWSLLRWAWMQNLNLERGAKDTRKTPVV